MCYNYNMRIINIIQNELILQKQKLENELERNINSSELSTDDKVKQILDLVCELNNIDASIKTWNSYMNKPEEKKIKMELIEKLENLMEALKADSEKFFEKGNKSAGVRTRKGAQDMKKLLQDLRKEVLIQNKK